MAELPPLVVVKPFLDVIRHEKANSFETGAALEAVMNILHLWPWTGIKDQHAVADAVSDIVDAVSHCRFEVTDVEGDQNVLVLVAHVLHAVVRSPCGVRLSDHSMWQLVESLYSLSRGSPNDLHITLPLRSIATNVLHDTVAFIFSTPAIYSDLPPPATDTTTSSFKTFTPGFGLPCAVKIVGFLCQKLHQRNYVPPPASDIPTPSIGSVTSRREVLLSFSLLQRALIACDAELMMSVPSLMLFIKDDLCSAILRYCRLGACTELQISVICLELIRLLWTKLRSELKMQVEAVFNGVFYHTLHWCLANMDVNNPSFPRGDDAALQSGNTNSQDDDKPVMMVDSALDEFSGDMLPKSRLYNISYEILDCLVDLLAEATLLPDLYVNYDCDDNRCDLTQTLFELLSQAAQHSHIACSESHDKTHFLWAQAIGEIALRGMFNALYVVRLRTQPETPAGGGESGSTPSDEEVIEDTLLLGDEAPLPANADEFVPAEVLFKKRQRKKFFQHGIQEFNRKPLAGIRYLQQNAFLPTPLDSVSLATFLRSLPQGLNKNSVGVYLGAMGKEVKGFEKTEIHEADTMDFHRDVLTNFVRSFNFEGESIVTALRMFLASFRLPGEAQQIDRILNAFSLQVYEQCRERFIMASVDVAYLLSFSLIMLNTDLHNPNIRFDKKMKLADFIKNNKNYGQEVSKGHDLPEDFLTELYATIAKNEIKTFEDGGKHGEVTSDRWKDLLYQAESDPHNSRLIVHHPSLRRLRSPSTPRSSDIARDSALPRARDVMQTMEETQLAKNASKPDQKPIARLKSGTWEPQDDFVPISASSGNQYDRHIYDLIQQSLVRAFSSVFQQFVADSQAKDAARGEDLTVGSSYEMHYIPQKSALQLACNGLVLCAAVASRLSLVEHCNHLFIRMCKYTALLSSDIYPVGYNGRENGIWVYCDNQSAPIATAAVLKLVSTCSLSLYCRSWKYFFHVVNGLRELHVLPSRILYPSSEMNLELMTRDERLEFIDLVYQNKEELERRIALHAQGQEHSDRESGGFFSGVAWLLSTLDSSFGGSAPTTTTKSYLSPDFEQNQLNPAELAFHTEDLVIEGNMPKKQTSDGEEDPRGEFGTDQWIQTTLQPYRLEFLMQDVASLPSRALAEVIEALHDEILLAVRGTDQIEASKDRRRSIKLSLSQGGCVLFEHLLSQVIALSGSLFDGGAADEDGISAVLEAHYTQILEFLRPVLLTNTGSSDLTYENACFLLHKSINGLFAWVTRTRSDVNGLLLVHFLDTLMEMSDGCQLIRPFLTPIMCGLKRYVTLVQPNNLHYAHTKWLTICSLISWSIGRPHAASHAFELLEQLVTKKIWNEAGNETLVSDCYTKMLMFAMKARDAHDSWAPSRPIDLLLFMFDTLQPDASNYIEERLRFLGGMTVLSRYLLLNQIKQEISIDLVVAAIEGLQHMLHEHAGTEQSFQPAAWLDILRYGLLPVGFDLLSDALRPKHFGKAMHFDDDEEEINSSFLYYRRQLPSFDEESSQLNSKDVVASSDATVPAGRRCWPSTMRDPLALRPHVVVVQLLSLVVCEELTKLQTCSKFLSVWKDVSQLLVGLLEHTAVDIPPSPGNGATSGEVLIAALERRSVLSAHEEILEHSRGIVRRLAVCQHEVKVQDTTEDQEKVELKQSSDAELPNVLMQILEEKCRSNAALLEQLFHEKDDTGSTGGRTPPVEVLDGELSEEQNYNDEAS